MATTNYIENTGPVLRFGVIAETEEEAVEYAESEIGSTSAWTDRGRPEWDEWEVVFERAYLD